MKINNLGIPFPDGASPYDDDYIGVVRSGSRWDIGAVENNEIYGDDIESSAVIFEVESFSAEVDTSFKNIEIYVYKTIGGENLYDVEVVDLDGLRVAISSPEAANYDVFFQRGESFTGSMTLPDLAYYNLSNVRFFQDERYASNTSQLPPIIGGNMSSLSKFKSISIFNIDFDFSVNAESIFSCVVRSAGVSAVNFRNNTVLHGSYSTSFGSNNIFIDIATSVKPDANGNIRATSSMFSPPGSYIPREDSIAINNGVVCNDTDRHILFNGTPRLYGGKIDIGAVESNVIDFAFSANDVINIFQDIITDKVGSYDNHKYKIDDIGKDAKIVIEMRSSRPTRVLIYEKVYEEFGVFNAVIDRDRIIVDNDYSGKFITAIRNFSSGDYVFSFSSNKLTVFKNPVKVFDVNKNIANESLRII